MQEFTYIRIATSNISFSIPETNSKEKTKKVAIYLPSDEDSITSKEKANVKANSVAKATMRKKTTDIHKSERIILETEGMS